MTIIKFLKALVSAGNVLFACTVATIALTSCGGNEDADRAFRAASANMGENAVVTSADDAYTELNSLSQKDLCKLTIAYYYLYLQEYETEYGTKFGKCYEKSLSKGEASANKLFGKLTDSPEAASALERAYNSIDDIEKVGEVMDNLREETLSQLEIKEQLADGALAFWDPVNRCRRFFSRDGYEVLSSSMKNNLIKLGLVVQLGNKYIILDSNYSYKDTSWPAAMRNASKVHSNDNGRWRLPTLSEARQLANIQDDISYWCDRWRGTFALDNLNHIETFVSDRDPSYYIDVVIENGTVKSEKTQRGDSESEDEEHEYTRAFYISDIQ